MIDRANWLRAPAALPSVSFAAMKTLVTARLREEAVRFRLQFCCDHCAYFEIDTESCSEGYPTEEHRDAELSAASTLFCKLFEAS